MRETRGDVVVGVCVRACVDVFIRVCVCFSFICEGLFCMFVCVFLYFCVCLLFCKFVHICLFVYVFVSLCVWECLFVYVCAVSVCV